MSCLANCLERLTARSLVPRMKCEIPLGKRWAMLSVNQSSGCTNFVIKATICAGIKPNPEESRAPYRDYCRPSRVETLNRHCFCRGRRFPIKDKQSIPSETLWTLFIRHICSTRISSKFTRVTNSTFNDR